MEPIVQCNAVSKLYKSGDVEVWALKNINLNVERGEFLSISGPSGSGKSTLLNLIGALDHPTSGTIKVAGEHLEKMSAAERAKMRLKSIGFIFQSYNLIPVLTAKENVEFVLQLQGVASAQRTALSLELLEEVGLKGMEHRRPSELSGGQQQRVAIARAIVSKPALVLADEPTANLDSKTAQGLLELMKRLNQEKNITFIFSTHDQLVMSYAQRLIKLHDGEIESDETR